MGKEVILDGICSVLVVEPNDAVNDYYSVAQRLADRRHQQQIKDAGLPALTRDNVPVEIAANIGSALEAPRAFTCGAQGIGLFRTEMLYMDRDTAPDEQEQFEAYQQVLLSAQGKPVIFRTMDIGGDKQIPYLNIPRGRKPVPRLSRRSHLSRICRSLPHPTARDLTRRRKRQCAVDDPDGAQPRSDFMDQTGAAKRS